MNNCSTSACTAGQFFFSDYGQDWIKVAVVDSADQRLKLLDFAPSADLPVDYAVHPITGDLYYVSIIRQQIRRIRYAGAVDGNLPPVAHGARTAGTALATDALQRRSPHAGAV